MRVNLTICRFQFGWGAFCGVQWSSNMLSASHLPLMDTVIDTVSEGLGDGQTAHLLKLTFSVNLWQSMPLVLQAKDLGIIEGYLLFGVVAVRDTQWKVIKSEFWPYVVLQQFSVVYFKCFFLTNVECWYPAEHNTDSTASDGKGTRGSHAHTTEVIVRIVREEEEHRGATEMKDVSLPVCHKGGVLLCDRLADRTSSISSGTSRRLLQSDIL